MKYKILLGLTTTSRSDWREKIKEIERFRIKEVALFPTFLKMDERRELYDLLEKTSLEKILHVHLRDDAEEWELDYLTKRYKTKVFNMHANEETENFIKKTKYKKNIYIENCENFGKDFEKLVKKCAGLCVDISHIEDLLACQKIKEYKTVTSLLKRYPIGCSHVSDVKNNFHMWKHYKTGKMLKAYSDHWLEDFSQLDYVRKYVQYLPKYVSIELENSFKEQLKAKKYLEKIING